MKSSNYKSHQLSVEKMRRRCRLSLTRMGQDSSIFSEDVENDPCCPNLPIRAIALGQVLGKGGFNSVRTLEKMHFDSSDATTVTNATVLSDGDYSVLSAASNSPKDYVVKQVRRSIKSNMKYNGIIDLAKEARFLSKLSHNHIIQIVSTGGVPGDSDYFLILERLEKSLSEQLLDWQADSVKIRIPSKKAKLEKLTSRLSRFEVGRQIASALAYLHSRNIVFRDLKPDNIGIDSTGCVKIFDFGLAKELRSSFHIEGDIYKNTKNAGTRRYMAPEVFLTEQYGLSADVYSFSIILWELVTLKTPFPNLSKEEHATFVFGMNCRPNIGFGWPTLLKAIVKCCWSEEPTERLTFQQIEEALSAYIKSKDKQLS